ncbi:MAG: hypothetical protein K2I81_01165 [Alphaproteobacteria bacterium]|nr:hypothetical protein [Alphaproteobacteria bacterium]
MKKRLIIIASAVICTCANAAEINHISECLGGTCPSNGHIRDGVVYGHCTSSWCDCATATVTYSLQCKCSSDDDCNTGYGCNNGLCTKCKTCANCTSDTSYSSAGTGYERRALKTCACLTGECKTSYSYRCAVGYYGTSTNGTSGCTRCPSSGGTYGTTASAGSQDITACYLPAGTPMSDGTGTFSCSDKSDYKK